MCIDNTDIATNLAQEYAQIARLLDEHIEYWEELLSYLFLADVGRLLVTEAPEDGDFVRSVFEWLEHAYIEGNEDVKDEIAIGMIESLPTWDEGGENVYRLMSPILAAKYEEFNQRI